MEEGGLERTANGGDVKNGKEYSFPGVASAASVKSCARWCLDNSNAVGRAWKHIRDSAEVAQLAAAARNGTAAN